MNIRSNILIFFTLTNKLFIFATKTVTNIYKISLSRAVFRRHHIERKQSPLQAGRSR